MNCREIQDELLLLIGQEALPDEIQQHLEQCADCRQLWSELKQQAKAVGSDEDFYVDDATVAHLTAQVDERIDKLELTKVTSISSAWKTHIPAAAAVLIMVGISFTVYLTGWLGGDGQQADVPQSGEPLIVVAEDEVEDIAQEELSDMLGGFFIDGDQAVQAVLQDDLTEIEYEYLDENFDVGDIL